MVGRPDVSSVLCVAHGCGLGMDGDNSKWPLYTGCQEMTPSCSVQFFVSWLKSSFSLHTVGIYFINIYKKISRKCYSCSRKINIKNMCFVHLVKIICLSELLFCLGWTLKTASNCVIPLLLDQALVWFIQHTCS